MSWKVKAQPVDLGTGGTIYRMVGHLDQATAKFSVPCCYHDHQTMQEAYQCKEAVRVARSFNMKGAKWL